MSLTGAAEYARTLPLRRVVATTTGTAYPEETLACGHRLPARQTWAGATRAASRRCPHCGPTTPREGASA